MSTLYKDDEELGRMWTEEFQKVMESARKGGSVDKEYKIQQDIYSKFATAYDDATRIEKWAGPTKIAERVNKLFPDNKDVKILDYGCGTGLVADYLATHGFKIIDGSDPNAELLEVAKAKNIMKNYFQIGSDDNHDCFETDSYDVITSSGVFLVSPSHPGFASVKMLLRCVRKGGYIVLLLKNDYLDRSYVQHSILEELEKGGKIKRFPKELFEGYRTPYGHEDDPHSTAAILIFQAI